MENKRADIHVKSMNLSKRQFCGTTLTTNK